MTQQQQQEQKQREEQQREEQQRAEQAREQQQREQQAREEQQRQEQQRENQRREEQEREQQAREEQQRERQEQQLREQQAREQQQREEQQREEQRRAEQAREQQQREQQVPEEQQRQEQHREEQLREGQEQGRQQQTAGTTVQGSRVASPLVNSKVTGASPAGSQASNDTGLTAPRTPALEPDGRIKAAASDRKNTAVKSEDVRLPASDRQHMRCDEEPCAEPGPKPIPPDLRAKLCKDGSCPVCAPGQSPGKDKSCVSTLAKEANAKPNPSVIPQSCATGQIWNGVQCATAGAQQCLPGQSNLGSSCQTACAIATAGAQNYIQLLRMARQDKDHACTQNPTGDECRSAGTTYDVRLSEYRTYLGGVPTGCALPDPISI